MNVNPTPSLKEQYGPKSQAWQEQQSPSHYDPEHQSLLMDWALGTIIVTGPKAWDFYDLFCSHRATLLRADGKDILGVTMALDSGGESNVDS
jgi:hypothetical protein